MKKTALVSFAKTLDSKPKSRLAIDIGRKSADDLYTLLVRTTDAAMSRSKSLLADTSYNLKTIWALTGTGEQNIFSSHVSIGQGEGSLGSRLFQVSQHIFNSEFAPDQIILIGSDWPSISAPCLLEAIAIEKACLGPATDGGFYLLSLPREIGQSLSEDVWNSISFSAADTRESLLRQIPCDFSFLKVASDLDALSDLHRCIEETEIVLTNTPDQMQHQSQLLENMRALQMDFSISNL